MTWGLAFGVILFASVPSMPAQEQDSAKPAKPVMCVMANSINRNYGINNKTLVFFLKGDKFYRVDLPAGCPTLAPGDSQIEFHYSSQAAKLTRLCSYDSFTVEHKPSAGCTLGEFRPITADEVTALVTPLGIPPPSLSKAKTADAAPAKDTK